MPPVTHRLIVNPLGGGLRASNSSPGGGLAGVGRGCFFAPAPALAALQRGPYLDSRDAAAPLGEISSFPLMEAVLWRARHYQRRMRASAARLEKFWGSCTPAPGRVQLCPRVPLACHDVLAPARVSWVEPPVHFQRRLLGLCRGEPRDPTQPCQDVRASYSLPPRRMGARLDRNRAAAADPGHVRRRTRDR